MTIAKGEGINGIVVAYYTVSEASELLRASGVTVQGCGTP